MANEELRHQGTGITVTFTIHRADHRAGVSFPPCPGLGPAPTVDLVIDGLCAGFWEYAAAQGTEFAGVAHIEIILTLEEGAKLDATALMETAGKMHMRGHPSLRPAAGDPADT